MRRAVVPLALVLALVSGVVLAEARLVLMAPIVADSADPRVHDNNALIRRFYAAVNEALERGDIDPVARLVDPAFVDHAPRPGATADRAGFLQAMASLHAVAPQLRLAVLDLLAQGDRVAARVAPAGGDGASFLGWPLPAGGLWGDVDMFRVEGGQVAEHWGASAMPASFASLLATTVPVERPTRKAVTLERWIYAPDAGETWVTGLGFLVVLVDAGTLTIEVDARSGGGVRQISHGRVDAASDDRPLAPGQATTLEPRDAVVIPQGNQIDLRNDGAEPAVAAVVQAVMPVPQPGLVSGAGGAPAAPGVVHTGLAGGLTANLPAGRATVAIGRATLATGAELLAHRVDVAELVEVESGSLALTADEGAAWVTSQVEGTYRADGRTVPAGGGVLVEAGATAAYHASGDGPLGLLVATIGPTPGDPAAAGASVASPFAANTP